MIAFNIAKGVRYMSIHGVPYTVLAVRDDNTVVAKCNNGRASKEFIMPIEQFARAMARQSSIMEK